MISFIFNKKGLPGLIIFLFTIIISACSDEEAVLPVLDTIKADTSEITSSSAVLRGRIIRTGNQKVLEYGIELSKTYLFDPSETKGFSTPPDTGLFEVEFINLDPATQYYFKAYALINTANVYSDNNLTFSTKQP
jgi:hypothetical protein